MDYNVIFANYLKDLDEEHDLISESLASFESIFSFMPVDKLSNHNRVAAIAYLCLKHLNSNGIAVKKRDIEIK